MRTLLDNVFSFLGDRVPSDPPAEDQAAGPTSHGLASQLLLRHPVPLYSQAHDLCLFWSAKSGCTFGVKWFLHHSGQLEKARAHSRWVHDYREAVLETSQQVREGITSVTAPGMRVVKLVRNPYARAVSSYLMAVRSGYENEQIGRFLQRGVDRDHGFSFAEFLDYLATIDLRNCNIHHRLQLHPAEEAGLIEPGYIIQLEDSLNQLAQCEMKLGLEPTDLGRFRKSGHNTARKVWPEFWGEVRFYRHLGTKILPQTANFYNDRLKTKVATLYGADFNRYDYDIDQVPGGNGLTLAQVAPERLLELIREQLPVVGPVEIDKRAEGYWPDSWCASRLKVQLTALAKTRLVSLSGCLPGGLLSRNSLTVKINGVSRQAEIDELSDFRVELPVKLQRGETLQLRVESAFSRSGVQAELNSDTRQLSFYLKEIAFHGDNR